MSQEYDRQLIAQTCAHVKKTKELVEQSKREIAETKEIIRITRQIVNRSLELLAASRGTAIFADTDEYSERSVCR